MLWKLWHIEEGLERNTREIKSKNKELEGLRADRDVRDQQLTAARAQQATSRTTVIQKERQIKRAEQTLEALVCLTFPFAPTMMQA
jgi:structural maintenance of chromosome 1